VTRRLCLRTRDRAFKLVRTRHPHTLGAHRLREQNEVDLAEMPELSMASLKSVTPWASRLSARNCAPVISGISYTSHRSDHGPTKPHAGYFDARLSHPRPPLHEAVAWAFIFVSRASKTHLICIRQPLGAGAPSLFDSADNGKRAIHPRDLHALCVMSACRSPRCSSDRH
jgi:hypothetical protein